MGKSVQIDWINRMQELPVKANSPTYLEAPAAMLPEPTRADYEVGTSMGGKTDVNTPTGSAGVNPITPMRQIFNSPPISGNVSFGQQDTSKSIVWVIAAIALVLFVYKRK